MKVAILTPPRVAGSRPDQDDTFIQAEEIAACLRELGHQPVSAIFDSGATADSLGQLRPDLVVNLVEEVPEGADHLHLATLLLDGLALPYTGARTEALRALGDKREMKRRLRTAGLPVPADPEHAPPGTPLIVKSATEHASFGLDGGSVVETPEAAGALIAERARTFGGDWFAEAFVHGREFNLSLIEERGRPVLLPIAEIIFQGDGPGQPRILGYAEKWDEASAAYAETPRSFPSREEPLFTQLEQLAVAAWGAFELSGYARVDFRVDPDGRPVILEVNANPCLARNAGFCAAAARSGHSQTDVVALLLAASR